MSGAGSVRLPRLTAALVRRCLPADRADEVLDDLREGLRARRNRQQPTTLWAWRQTLAFVLRVPAAAAIDACGQRRAHNAESYDFNAPRARLTSSALRRSKTSITFLTSMPPFYI